MSGGCTAPFGDSGGLAQANERQGFRQTCDSRNANSILVDLHDLLYPGTIGLEPRARYAEGISYMKSGRIGVGPADCPMVRPFE